MADEVGPDRRFREDLIGLDPDDPEAQAFARHLDRMQRCDPGFTVESSISRVAEFADSSNRAGGLRWLASILIVCLLLLGVLFTAWETLGQVLG